ncbi:MAG: ribosome-associated translation inhibitor RaiA [Bacteroidales bacterium]|jgi:ribosomal subunit interface protein|nr:ribosome-associated translation inhibitor RaiA [Bacteroidales bacterium]MDD3161304.1 ribosome-associated translation inhibitor RaiA [Bacteroidales bacterium]
MEIKIKAIHFDASQQLESFILKKVSKLEQYFDGILTAEVTLKVVKPETVENKEAQIKVLIANNDIFASKISNTFEESIDESVEALTKQLLKYKEKMRQK